jgi:hypothetical protein
MQKTSFRPQAPVFTIQNQSFLEKKTVPELEKKFPAFVEPEISLPSYQNPAIIL